MVGGRRGRSCSHLFYYSAGSSTFSRDVITGKEKSESGNMDKGNGLQSIIRPRRNESGNMDKGSGHMARDCPKVSDMKSCQYPDPVEAEECEPW
ncbi:hypothetical protein HPP92_022388 [Vanilla planifolia]|uniref:Uncharacterized protein n=1 Tax=Vanilla planifolia TaxID=51239 RepID=A0A835PS44_VANPL|nr:hypothetical protein HPP92_022388 [Vanilla planifolia]